MGKSFSFSIKIISLLAIGVWSISSGYFNIPIIVLDEMGESLPNVQRDSSFQFSMTEDLLKGVHTYFVVKPFSFSYNPQNDMGFKLKPGRFASLMLLMGHVDHIHLNPHLEYLSLYEAIEETSNISDMLDEKGWQRVIEKRAYFSNLTNKEILTYFTENSHKDAGEFVRSWEAADGTTIQILLVRKRLSSKILFDGADEHEAKDFLLEVRLENKQVSKSYGQLAERYHRIDYRTMSPETEALLEQLKENKRKRGNAKIA